ncbi:MAG: hypothetical protein QXH30_03410 [Candidatus Bilamarchaeaceae archaeon]
MAQGVKHGERWAYALVGASDFAKMAFWCYHASVMTKCEKNAEISLEAQIGLKMYHDYVMTVAHVCAIKDAHKAQRQANMPEEDTKERFKNIPAPYLTHEIEADLKANLEKFKDPVVLAAIAYKLLEERENTNRILKNVLARLDQLEAGREGGEPPQNMLLPEIDQKIIDFVSRSGKATAQDVQKEFGYRGSNAASSRMNRLVEMGVLEKRQVGRKVFFLLR